MTLLRPKCTGVTNAAGMGRRSSSTFPIYLLGAQEEN